jgi:hypothetical protein
MRPAARAAPVGAGTAPGGRAAAAVELLKVLPVMDPEAWPGVVAGVRSVKAGPVLVAGAGQRPVGSSGTGRVQGVADSVRLGPKAAELEAKERVPGWPGPGDHLEERWGHRSNPVGRSDR